MQATRKFAGLPDLDPRTDLTVWGTTALKHATSWFHVDDDGFGTVVTNMVGSKYWVLARKRRDAASGTIEGDMGTVEAFGKKLRPLSARSNIWEHEGLLLTPGTVL
jgi:hypothetical protein